MKNILAGLVAATLAISASAQVSLSGISAWTSTSSTGAKGVGWWDTHADGTYGNVYLFTGSPSSPTFLNGSSSGTDVSLAPNLTLVAGTNTVQFATNSLWESYLGINLFFDGNLTTSRISAVVQDNVNPGVLYPVSAATTTWGEGADIVGANSYSYTTGGYTITLTGLTVLSPASSYDLVGNFATGPDTVFDNFGTMTLVVTAVPELSTFAALASLAALSFAIYTRRPKPVR